MMPVRLQAQWIWQNPLPQGNQLYSVRFTDPLNGWASTSGGTLLNTTDGGATWALVQIPARIFAECIFFVNKNVGWTGGPAMDAGPSELLGTTDGGKTWSVQLIDSIAQFESIFFADERQGWTTGYAGRIFHTSNGGISWGLQADNLAQDIHNLSFTDSLNGWAAGEINRRLHTTDGGTNWLIDTLQYSLYDISFLDSLRGWECGEGKIDATTDGGYSWHVQLDTFQVRWQDIFIWNGAFGWAVSYEGLIAATTDGGVQWTYQGNPSYKRLNGISFVDSLHGVAVGHQGTILSTTNGGASWQNQTRASTFQPLWGIHFVDTLRGWIAGWRGTVLKTTDGGSTWDSLHTGTSKRLFDVYFLNDLSGWAVGEAGTIIRTTDGGSSWSAQISPTVAPQFTNIDFRNYPIGWIIGGDILSVGYLLKTTDGGNIWNEDSSVSLPGDAKSIQFTDANVGWILAGAANIGAQQAIYRTTNGGTSWQNVFSIGIDTALLSLSFVNDSVGWVSTDRYTIHRTSDQGNNWTQFSSPAFLNSIQFFDTANGLGGDELAGEIFSTSDKGLTWSMQHSPFGGPVNSIKFINPRIGWAVGQFGAIIHTTTGGTTAVELPPTRVGFPSSFTLYQNYPNPFNSQTTISFALMKPARQIVVEIHDILGRTVKSFSLSGFNIGMHAVHWNGTSEGGRELSSGVYFYTVSADGLKLGSKMLLLR